MAKKKAPVDKNATFKNGMNIERTKHAAVQGCILLAFLCVCAIFSYIVSMIPAGLFGVAITKDNTTNQTVYDIQNIVLAVLCLAVVTIGGNIFAKKTGEADAEYVFREGLERKLDMRYLTVSVVIAAVAYFLLYVVINIDFFAGAGRYIGIFLTRAERSINEGIKVGIGFRAIAMLICMAFITPAMFKGVKDGWKDKMEDLTEGEEEEKRKEAERAASEAEFQERSAIARRKRD